MGEPIRPELRLPPPWYESRVSFDPELPGYVVHADYAVGATFTCTHCGTGGCAAYDSATRLWRDLDVDGQRVYLKAYTPRVTCPRCGVRQAVVPWARPRIRWTKAFEAYVARLAATRSVRQVARMIGEHDTRVGRILKHAAGEAP